MVFCISLLLVLVELVLTIPLILNPDSTVNINTDLKIKGVDILDFVKDLNESYHVILRENEDLMNRIVNLEAEMDDFDHIVRFFDSDVESYGRCPFSPSYQTPQFGMDKFGIVHFRGIVDSRMCTTEEVITDYFKLPLSFRPMDRTYLPSFSFSKTGFHVEGLNIRPNVKPGCDLGYPGMVLYLTSVNGPPYDNISFDGVSFLSSALESRTDWNDQITLQNGWTYTIQPKIAHDPYGVIRMKGQIIPGTASVGTTIFELPDPSFYPETPIYIFNMANGPGLYDRYTQPLKIDTNGNVKIFGAYTGLYPHEWMNLDNTRFTNLNDPYVQIEFRNITNFTNGWHPLEGHRTPQYGMDASGVVHFRGMITGVKSTLWRS